MPARQTDISIPASGTSSVYSLCLLTPVLQLMLPRIHSCIQRCQCTAASRATKAFSEQTRSSLAEGISQQVPLNPSAQLHILAGQHCCGVSQVSCSGTAI